MLCFSMLLIALTRFIEAKRLHAYLSLFFSSKYFKRYSKDIRLFETFNIVFFIVFALCLTILCYPFLKSHFLDYNLIYSYLIIFSGMFLFFGTKLCVELMVAKVLKINFISKIYLFQKYSYKHFMGRTTILKINSSNAENDQYLHFVPEQYLYGHCAPRS